MRLRPMTFLSVVTSISPSKSSPVSWSMEVPPMVMREAPVRACWAIHSMYSLVTSPLGVSRQQIMGEN